MSFDNGMYIFSEVPGYDASKGERIVKAFQKLQEKIEHLEQVRIVEKNTRSQKAQTNTDSDLTITDIQYEILLTQIRYLIKIVREYANDNPSTVEMRKGVSREAAFSSSNCLGFQSEIIDNVQSNTCEATQPDASNHGDFFQAEDELIDNQPKDEKHTNNKISSNAHNLGRANSSTSTNTRLPCKNPKLIPQSHYHLKLDDVPFILGGSVTESHSMVATVQSIISKMKFHNKALCAPKLPNRHCITSDRECVNKTHPQDTNEMIKELSEDLSKLTKRQESLIGICDKAQADKHPDATKSKMELRNWNAENKKIKVAASSRACGGEERTSSVNQKDNKQSVRKTHKVTFEPPQKHSVPTVKIQTNNNPHLARRIMLRSLKDFKMHLSAEDISWK